jgi:hypothetical protein
MGKGCGGSSASLSFKTLKLGKYHLSSLDGSSTVREGKID